MKNSDFFHHFTQSNDSLFLNSSSYGVYAPSPSSSSMQNTFSSSFSYYPSLEASDHAPSHEDKALAALRNHKEAEKRRRERINSHLDKLRTLLPCNSKTDKASLLAKVVERVKELKQQMSEITNSEQFLFLPSETDEISVMSTAGDQSGGDGRLTITASLCCEDRSDLISDLIEILRSLQLKMVKAEMVTLGGRTRNVLIVETEKDRNSVDSIQFLQNSLKSLLERSSCNHRSKRHRIFDGKSTT